NATANRQFAIGDTAGTNFLRIGIGANGTWLDSCLGATPLVFQPNGGRVGIGTTPAETLHVYGGNANQLRLQENDSYGFYWDLYVQQTSGNMLFVAQNGTTCWLNRLNGSFNGGSDRRLKKDIEGL